MKIVRKFCLYLTIAVFAVCTPFSVPTVLPQDSDTPAADSQGRITISVKVNTVNVPVTVRKRDGGFIKGLSQDAFRIYEDGVPQEISLFTQEALPTNIAIVLDISGSVGNAWGSIQHATRKFVEQLHPEDKFSLFTFNTQIRLKMDWGNNTDRMDQVLGSIFCTGNTKVWDTIWAIGSDAFKGIEGKKAIIIMSDGMDNRSIKTYDEAVEEAVRSEAAVYIVSKTEALRQMYLYDKRKYGDPYGLFRPEDFVIADLALRNLAEKTGGRVLYPNSFGQLNDIYEEVIEELRNQYTIGYVSNNAINDGSYRNIDVRVNVPDSSVTARPGYYAPNEIP